MSSKNTLSLNMVRGVHILNNFHLEKLRYSTHAQKCKPLCMAQNHSSVRDDIEIFGLSI